MVDPFVDEDAASFSGSARVSSGPDDAVFEPTTTRSSPRTSNGSSDNEFSLLESTYSPSRSPSLHHTPLKQRSPFRNPSSVRAMQRDTTPPHLSSSMSHRRLASSRQKSTPRSSRSNRGTPSRLMNSSPTKTTKKEHPLVLLHVTLLPIPHEYPRSVLEHVLPPTIMANWELLMEKTSPTVLHRGVLIPHPREDYDLLEERLLESLELKQPRLLKCGHFHLTEEEEADIEVYEDEVSDSEETGFDGEICADCGRRVRDGHVGDTGSGSRRWNVKVFAANGLMRAGAWQAAWREMERVDVEVLPWMEENMRRELELRTEEEEQMRREDELARQEEGVGGLDDERLKEIYGHEGQSFTEASDGTAAKAFQDSQRGRRSTSLEQKQQLGKSDIPLLDLLRNCCLVLARDRRNIALLILSIFVLFLSLRSPAPTGDPSASPASISTAVSSNGVPVDSILPALQEPQDARSQTPSVARSMSKAPEASGPAPDPMFDEASSPSTTRGEESHIRRPDSMRSKVGLPDVRKKIPRAGATTQARPMVSQCQNMEVFNRGIETCSAWGHAADAR